MKQKAPLENPASYNTVVEQAYDCIFKRAKQLLASIERDDLRTMFERKNTDCRPDTIMHEVINPLLYLRLECERHGMLTIRFGIEPITKDTVLSALTAQFLRTVFAMTDKAVTACNIEQCIKTDWFINSCSDMFEYLEMRNKHHTVKQVQYKVSAPKQSKILTTT
jgi:hypothetical protein